MKAFRFDTESKVCPELHVKTNEIVAIEIEGGGTTGYLWEVARPSSALEVVRHSIEPNLEAFGAAGRDRFEVRVKRPGSHDLTLKLKAPWDKTAAKEFKVKIATDQA
jgi:predicted secreted protein